MLIHTNPENKKHLGVPGLIQRARSDLWQGLTKHQRGARYWRCSGKCLELRMADNKLWQTALTFSLLSLKYFLFFIYLLCIQYSVCVYVCRPEDGTRPHYRWLWATMWLLGIELRTFGRAGNALNHWAISPALKPILEGNGGSLSKHLQRPGC